MRGQGAIGPSTQHWLLLSSRVFPHSPALPRPDTRSHSHTLECSCQLHTRLRLLGGCLISSAPHARVLAESRWFWSGCGQQETLRASLDNAIFAL